MKCMVASLLPVAPIKSKINSKTLCATFCSPPGVLSVMTASSKAPQRQLSLSKSLKSYRTEQSERLLIPESSVLGEKLIRAIVSRRPETLEKLQTISGMGHKRLVMYGTDILKLVSQHKKRRTTKAVKPRGIPKKAAQSKVKKTAVKARKPVKVPKRPRPRPRPKPTQPRPYGPRCSDALKSSDALAMQASAQAKGDGKKSSVYILQLEDDRIYVGTSQDVERRVLQHVSGKGAAFTRRFKPTGVRLPRLGNVSGDGDAAERDETLRYMYLKGIDMVRGWKYTQVEMSSADALEAESNIRELFNLCRRCGGKGHFVGQCRCTMNRLGTYVL